MDMDIFLFGCKDYVIDDSLVRMDAKLNDDNVYVVWSCKTLQNCKALLANDLPNDNNYYEFTYNGDNHQIYVDRYVKEKNEAIIEELFLENL